MNFLGYWKEMLGLFLGPGISIFHSVYLLFVTDFFFYALYFLSFTGVMQRRTCPK
jgi:hypothetical protein